MKTIILIIIVLMLMSCTSLPYEMTKESTAEFDSSLLFVSAVYFVVIAETLYLVTDNYLKEQPWH